MSTAEAAMKGICLLDIVHRGIFTYKTRIRKGNEIFFYT